VAANLPMRAAPNRPGRAAPVPPPAPAGPLAGPRLGLRILVVDDDPLCAGLMARLLAQCGHRVRAAGCVDDCLRAAAAEAFDLLITDVHLPDGSGLDLLERVRAAATAAPLASPVVPPPPGRGVTQGITVTGFGEVERTRASAAAGYAGHLIKPIHFETLEQLIARLFPTAADPA